MIKILCVADIHIEQLEYEKAEKQIFDFFIKEVKKHKPDLIAICGDLFDNKLQLNSKYTRLMNKMIFELTKTNSTIWIIHGTLYHDNYQIFSFSHYVSEKFLIFSEVKIQKYKNLNILILPEEYTNDKYKYYDGFVFNNKLKYDFVFGHGMFSHVGYSNKVSKIKKHAIFSWKDFENKVYGRVVFGHDHKRSNYKNIHYVGSLSRFTFGYENPKGFTIYEYDEIKREITKESFIENPFADQYKTINYKQLKKDNIEKQIKEILLNTEYLKIKLDNNIDDIMKHDIFSYIEKEKRVSIQIVSEVENRINKISQSNKSNFDSKKYEKKHWLDITVDELHKKNKPMKHEEILDLINN